MLMQCSMSHQCLVGIVIRLCYEHESEHVVFVSEFYVEVAKIYSISFLHALLNHRVER